MICSDCGLESTTSTTGFRGADRVEVEEYDARKLILWGSGEGEKGQEAENWGF